MTPQLGQRVAENAHPTHVSSAAMKRRSLVGASIERKRGVERQQTEARVVCGNEEVYSTMMML